MLNYSNSNKIFQPYTLRQITIQAMDPTRHLKQHSGSPVFQVTKVRRLNSRRVEFIPRDFWRRPFQNSSARVSLGDQKYVPRQKTCQTFRAFPSPPIIIRATTLILLSDDCFRRPNVLLWPLKLFEGTSTLTCSSPQCCLNDFEASWGDEVHNNVRRGIVGATRSPHICSSPNIRSDI